MKKHAVNCSVQVEFSTHSTYKSFWVTGSLPCVMGPIYTVSIGLTQKANILRSWLVHQIYSILVDFITK